MSNAATIGHSMRLKITSPRQGTGVSLLLETAVLAFVAGAALATAIPGLPPAASPHAVDIRPAIASTGSFAEQDTSLPDASKEFEGAGTTVAEPVATF